MIQDRIKAIEIDDKGHLHIITSKAAFPLVYRTATEVHWNPEKHSLYSPIPREWSYKMWYDYILEVAKKECGCDLIRDDRTNWINIPLDLKSLIENQTG